MLVIATTLVAGFGMGYLGMHVTKTWLKGDNHQVSVVPGDLSDSNWPTPNPQAIVNLPADQFTQLDMEKLMTKWCGGSVSNDTDAYYTVLRECVERANPEQ